MMNGVDRGPRSSPHRSDAVAASVSPRGSAPPPLRAMRPPPAISQQLPKAENRAASPSPGGQTGTRSVLSSRDASGGQPHARPAAVLGDELDASGLEHFAY